MYIYDKGPAHTQALMPYESKEGYNTAFFICPII